MLSQSFSTTSMFLKETVLGVMKMSLNPDCREGLDMKRSANLLHDHTVRLDHVEDQRFVATTVGVLCEDDDPAFRAAVPESGSRLARPWH